MGRRMVLVQAAILVLCFSSFGVCQRKTARCDMHPDSNLDVESVTGPIYMEQTYGAELKFIVNLTYNGYPPSNDPDAGPRYDHAMHVHVNAPVAAGECQTTGGDYNPTDANHGGRFTLVRSSWTFIAQVKAKMQMGDSGDFSVTTSSLTIELMTVTKPEAWRETHTFTNVCFIYDSLHQNKDDRGEGGDAQSLIDGNSGPAIACCKIIES